MDFSQTSPKDRTACAASFPVISALGMGARWPKKPAKNLNFKVFLHLGQNVWGEMGGGDGGGSMLASAWVKPPTVFLRFLRPIGDPDVGKKT